MEDDQMEEEAVEEPDMGYVDEPDEVEDVLDDMPMKVYEGLYIGSLMAEMNRNALLRAGITDVLQVAQGLYPHHPFVFNYMNIQVQDMPSEDLVRYFPSCFEFIDRAISKGGAVLVHCAAGVSRSATVVLGYLMSRYSMKLTAAVEHLKAIRPWVSPNTGFLKQLEIWQGISYDMTKWRAWQLVWQEVQQEDGQQQNGQQQNGQQHWLQIPQVHTNSNSSSTNATATPVRLVDESSSGAGSALPALAPAAAAAGGWHGSSLLRPPRDSSSSNCCSCLGCGIGCCFNDIGPSGNNSSSSSSATISIKCNAAGVPAAAAPQQHQQESGSSWDNEFRYSSSAPEHRSQNYATAACAAACAAADGSGGVVICTAPVAGRNGYAINGIASDVSFASGSHISSSSSSSGYAAAGVLDLDSAGNSAASHTSCLKVGTGLNLGIKQQGSVQGVVRKPQRRHVAFALDTAPTCAAAAPAAVGAPAGEIVMEDSGGYVAV